MQRAGFWCFLILFVPFFTSVLGDITVKVEDTPVVNVPFPVTWVRGDDDDPSTFFIRKITTSNPNGVRPVDIIPVNTSGEKQGKVLVTFDFEGEHQLFALKQPPSQLSKNNSKSFKDKGSQSDKDDDGDGDDNDDDDKGSKQKGSGQQEPLASSDKFTVLAQQKSATSSSASSTSGASSTSQSTSSDQPSITSSSITSLTLLSSAASTAIFSSSDQTNPVTDTPLPSLSSSSSEGTTIIFPSSSDPTSNSLTAGPTVSPPPVMAGDMAATSSSRTPIIVGSAIGTLVFVLIFTALLLIWLRRRRERKLRPSFMQARMVSGLDQGVGGFNRVTPLYTLNLDDAEAYGGLQPAPPYGDSRYSGFSQDRKSPLPFDDQESTLRFVPLTDRQMELEERIIEWQSKLIGADRNTVREVQAKIETLKKLQGSDWAREKTDEIPVGML